MAVYHQMGHDSRNLLSELSQHRYAGAILSPVNENHASMAKTIKGVRKATFEFIFDPQLFYPRSQRGHLSDWDYFPSDFDTADSTQSNWWCSLNRQLISSCQQLNIGAICSPIIAPKTYADGYYDLAVDVCNDLCHQLKDTPVNALQTILLKFDDLSSASRVFEIASIISKTKAKRCYVILVTDTVPRRELADTDSLRGAIDFIDAVEGAGLKTLVGYTSTDIILWKFARASGTATGKFFNLRRFSPERWHESEERKGGQLPHWTEESLMALLRDVDLDRLMRANLIPSTSQTPTPAQRIIRQRQGDPDAAWLALSWRQYLHWYQEFDHTHPQGFPDADSFLVDVEEAWDAVENTGILMDERRNDGHWVRRWRKAIRESRRWQALRQP